MVISPLKPTAFHAKIPREPRKDEYKLPSNPLALIVTIGLNSSIGLNREPEIASIENIAPLIEKLSAEFQLRRETRVYDENLAARNDLSDDEKVLKTVFIKAPRAISYGEVAKVVDAVKSSGANVVGLQIDALD
jgi:biopolymer transport protein ExbD